MTIVLAWSTVTQTADCWSAPLEKVTSCTFTSPISSYLSSNALIACLASCRRVSPGTPEASFILPDTSMISSRLESTCPGVTERSAPTTLGTSSMMFTSRVALAELPSLSVATTVIASFRLLVPLALGWFSLSSKVKLYVTTPVAGL
ncbi:hypothetical protein D9M71_525760 [compost metagenome]